MKLKIFLLLFLVPLLPVPGQSQTPPWSGILSPSRAIDWSQAGLPGGIPNRTTICATITASTYGNGSSDATSGIQSALNNCASGGVVSLSSGTFLVDGNLTVPSNVTLRGAGADQTILNAKGSGGAVITLGGQGSPNINNSVSITGGATAGSASITVSNASGITVGSYLLITELNDPSFVTINGSEGTCTWCDGGLGWNGTRAAGQIVEVESISGTTIGISPGLYMAYPNSPLATPFKALGKYVGVENLQIYANDTGYSASTEINMCAYCWVSGIEDNYADADHLDIDWGYHDQVQNSYFSNAYVHTAGSTDSDLDLRNKTSASLIQNNILERLHVSIMLEWGPSGNVIAYNYMFGNFDGGGSLFTLPSVNVHGAHPMYNLFEGNVETDTDFDSIWGSNSDNTFFRNWDLGTTKLCDPLSGRGVVNCSAFGSNSGTQYSAQFVHAEDFDFLSSSENSVGNVLGSQDLASLNIYNRAGSPMPQTKMVVSLCGPSPCGAGSRSYDQNSYDYSLGFGESSDDGTGGTNAGAGCGSGVTGYSCHSLTPYSTLFVHGDYSSADKSITWATGVTQTLPASFFLTSKPAWFGSVPWPAIGPDVTGGLANAYGHAYAIPAEVCYTGVMGGTDGTGSPLNFNASKCYGTTVPDPPANLTATAQ